MAISGELFPGAGTGIPATSDGTILANPIPVVEKDTAARIESIGTALVTQFESAFEVFERLRLSLKSNKPSSDTQAPKLPIEGLRESLGLNFSGVAGSFLTPQMLLLVGVGLVALLFARR